MVIDTDEATQGRHRRKEKQCDDNDDMLPLRENDYGRRHCNYNWYLQ